MILLVAHKLTPNRDYSAFYEALKGTPARTWWHYIDSVWLIKTDETPETMNARISPFINQGVDLILIMKVDGTVHKGWLPKEAHDWINIHGNDPQTAGLG